MSIEAPPNTRVQAAVLGVPVDALSWTEAVNRIFAWAKKREVRTVCLCNVHSAVTAMQDGMHMRALRAADLVAPDGAPVAWRLRRLGYGDQERISGPDLMWTCCRRAAADGTEMLLYGGSPATLLKLRAKLLAEFPGVNIVGALSPVFRPLSEEEDDAVVEAINQSGARIVWVGLGCPKQEAWMFEHAGKVRAVLIGVGAAFDFHAGTVKRAPPWMQRIGLEWLHRLLQNPRRLWKRYLIANTVFALYVVRDAFLRGRAARRVRLS